MSSSHKYLESSLVALRDALPPNIRVHFFHEESFIQRASPLITAFGAAALTYYTAKGLICGGKWITSYLLAGPLNLGADLKKSGDWAVITGGSDGIGKEFAFQLAQKGLNVVLVARNLEKLEGVAREISVKFNVQTKIIAIDLAKMGPHNVPQMQEELKDLNIAALINVAGTVGSPARFLHNPTTDEDAANLVNLNARAVVMMCRAVMPLMLARGASPSNRRFVINVGGILGGAAPAAGFALYGASKAFLDSFSQALDYEYRSLGISVQSLIPGATLTKILPGSAKGYKLVATPAEVVYGSLAQLGLRSRTFGHWKHGLRGCMAGMASVIDFIPRVPA